MQFTVERRNLKTELFGLPISDDFECPSVKRLDRFILIKILYDPKIAKTIYLSVPTGIVWIADRAKHPKSEWFDNRTIMLCPKS